MDRKPEKRNCILFVSCLCQLPSNERKGHSVKKVVSLLYNTDINKLPKIVNEEFKD